jgi:long-chain fatty acid transport protein
MNRVQKFALAALPMLAVVPPTQAGGPAFSGLFAEANNAETVYNNPAGMTRLEGTQVTGQGIFIMGFSQFEVDEELTTVDGGNPRDSNPAFVPAGYYSREFNNKWWLGASLNVPTGFGSNHGPDWAGRYYSDKFSLFYVTFSPSAAYKVNEHLSLGVGLSVVYTSSETSVQVNNKPFLAGAPDGRAEVESDGVGLGWSLSALYEFTENTRIGLSYRSESDSDLDATVDFESVIRPPGIIEELESQTIQISDTVPMNIGGGIFHRMDNDWEFTWDVIWMEFSSFGVTEIRISDEDIQVPEGEYEDFFATSLGLSFPLRPNLRGSIGAMYLEQPIKDENRGFGISLDEMWGIGAGILYNLDSGNDVEMNLNLIDTGKAPIDTGHDPISGRVVGKSEDHYAITVDISFHWK